MSLELGALTILIITSVVLVLIAVMKANPLWCHWITGGSLGAAFYIQCLAFFQPSSELELLNFTPANIVLSQLVIIIVLIIWGGFRPWSSQRTSSPEVFYLLLLWLTIGTLVMVVSDHFTIFFISLELISLSLIGLIAFQYPHSNEHDLAIEAAIKYLILSAIASAFILLGFALIYIDSGSLAFNTIAITGNQGLLHPWFITGAIIFILVGSLFKLSIVPCHLWFADVVQGAPAPVAALVTTLTKLAVFVVVYRLFATSHWLEIKVIEQIVTITAISSMLLGNILALKQRNIFRLLAYSSIAHFGYLLILISLTSIVSSNAALLNQEVLIIYLSAYLLALTGVFAILSQISNCDTIEKLQGLLWRQPCLAIVFMLMILSLAGIPLTFGFVAKFYLVLTSVDNQQWYLLSALILGSIISMFYYFNLIINLTKRNLQPPNKYLPKTNIGAVVINVLIILVIIGLGIYPQPIAQLIQSL